MRTSIVAACAVVLATTLSAFSVDIDFQQKDTPAPDGGWGAEWKVEGAPVFIQDNLGKKQSDNQTIAIHEKAALPNGPFILSAEVYAQANDRWIGLVFDYQSPENYAVWRVKFSDKSAFEPTPWQLLKIRDGKQSVVQQGTVSPGAELADPAPLKTWRGLQIERESDGQFLARIIADLKNSPVSWSTDLKWDDESTGRGGVLLSNGFVWVSKFAVTSGQ